MNLIRLVKMNIYLVVIFKRNKKLNIYFFAFIVIVTEEYGYSENIHTEYLNSENTKNLMKNFYS